MEYRRLGKSGLKVSEISLGTLGFGLGRGRSEQESISVIAHALDLGINFIDTADVYDAGHSEELVGKAVKGKRSKTIIATKFGIPTGEQPNDYGGSRYHVMEAIDASLKRLGTDYIDLYYIHWPDPTTPIEETLRTLGDLVRAGKVRYIGCSNFTAWQLCYLSQRQTLPLKLFCSLNPLAQRCHLRWPRYYLSTNGKNMT